jgi:hypothetical protein
VFGNTAPAALLAVHLLVGWVAVLPLLAAFTWASARGWDLGTRRRVVAGGLYGAAMWLVVNSWALPALTGHSSPWAGGALALWPSLTVHVAYGTVAAWMLPPDTLPVRRRAVVAPG